MNASQPPDAAVGSFFRLFPSRQSQPAAILICMVFGLLFVVGTAPTRAQTTIKIAGYVYDAVDGRPINQAKIRIQGSDFKVFTDQFGSFALEHIPDGRRILEVEAPGYLPAYGIEVEVTADITSRVTIRLNRKIFNLGETEVRGKLIPTEIGSLEIIDRREIEKLGNRTLAEVLNRLEGVYIQETGPVGGEKRISIRGSAPKHVLVLVDGRRLNPAGSGEADLSNIPLEIIERVEVYRGGESARFGPDALAGVINIITHVGRSQKSPELKTGMYWGKWNTDLREVALLNPVKAKGLTTKFAYGYKGTSANFDYDYSTLPRHDVERNYEGTRANADFESRNYFLSGIYQTGPQTSLSASGQVYQARQGLPGRASSPDYESRKEDNRFFGSLRFQHDFSIGHHFEMAMGYSRLDQQFTDLTDAIPYDTRYINDIADWQTMSKNRLWAGNELSSGATFQRDILYHDDWLNPDKGTGRTVRDNTGLFISDLQIFNLDRVPIWDIASFDVSIRWDNTDTKKDAVSEKDSNLVQHHDHWSQKIGASISRGNKTRLTIRGSYGTSYRLPSINALFWKSDVRSAGNPELKSEQAEHSDAGIEISIGGRVKISGGIAYFHNRVKNIIVWRPGSPLGIWKPENLEAALITGHEDFIRVDLFNERLRLSYSNTITRAQNKSPGSTNYNKILTFRPHYLTNLEGRLHFWKFHSSYNIRLVDIRYALEANSKWYGAYRIDNADLGFKTEISRFTIEIDYRVKNLHGENYELIAHYPMPGREWGVGVSLQYRLESDLIN